MTHTEFVEEIAKYVTKYAPQYGICVYSPIIAQAILESGWGTSNKAKHNNFFGLKYRLGRITCNSGYFTDTSSEEYSPGIYTPISDQWYEFATVEDGVHGYFQFINISNYSNLKGVVDPETYLTRIKQDGYATSSSYVPNLMKLIESQNLNRFDPVSGEVPAEQKGFTVKINQNTNFGTHNTSVRNGKIKYIVIHYVGSTGDAKNNVLYFNQRSTVNASADFFVGFAGDIWQYNPDPEKRYCWAVGGGRQSIHGGKYYGIATNPNCVSIEMCVRNKGNLKDNSPDWYFEKATIDSTVELTKYLMQKYGIAASNVIRHFDVNGKSCPGVVGWNSITGDESAWNDFKRRIADDSKDSAPAIAAELYRIRKTWAEVSSQVGAYRILDNAKANCPPGYTVYDENGKAVWSVSVEEEVFVPYHFKVTIPDLNIRKGPGTEYKKNGVTGIGIFTIVEESDGRGADKWGKLKSGMGWIALDSDYGYKI